jgi:transposase
MTMPLSRQELIRTMSAEGRSEREIARELGISRNTVAKYVRKEDFSPEPPVRRRRASPTMEPYAGMGVGARPCREGGSALMVIV